MPPSIPQLLRTAAVWLALLPAVAATTLPGAADAAWKLPRAQARRQAGRMDAYARYLDLQAPAIEAHAASFARSLSEALGSLGRLDGERDPARRAELARAALGDLAELRATALRLERLPDLEARQAQALEAADALSPWMIRLPWLAAAAGAGLGWLDYHSALGVAAGLASAGGLGYASAEVWRRIPAQLRASPERAALLNPTPIRDRYFLLHLDRLKIPAGAPARALALAPLAGATGADAERAALDLLDAITLESAADVDRALAHLRGALASWVIESPSERLRLSDEEERWLLALRERVPERCGGEAGRAAAMSALRSARAEILGSRLPGIARVLTEAPELVSGLVSDEAWERARAIDRAIGAPAGLFDTDPGDGRSYGFVRELGMELLTGSPLSVESELQRLGRRIRIRVKRLEAVGLDRATLELEAQVPLESGPRELRVTVELARDPLKPLSWRELAACWEARSAISEAWESAWRADAALLARAQAGMGEALARLEGRADAEACREPLRLRLGGGEPGP